MVSLPNFPSKRGQKELAYYAEREQPKVMNRRSRAGGHEHIGVKVNNSE